MKKYVDFLKLFRGLRKHYQENNWGDSPNLPGPFTEDLIAKLYHLKKITNTNTLDKNSKGNDLCDQIGNEYEVKATTSLTGKTTVKNSDIIFYKMFWLFCDFDKEKISVKRISYDSYYTIFKNNSKGKTTKRISMTLSKLEYEEKRIFCMKTLKEETRN